MGRVCVDSFDVSRIAKSGDDKGLGHQLHHSSAPTSYLIENGYDVNNRTGFHTTSKRRSVTRSSISSIYGSTPRPSFSSYPFSRTDSFSSAATSSYSNVFEDDKPALGLDHESILEQDGDESEDRGDDQDDEDGDTGRTDDDDVHWNDTNEESYVEDEFEDDDDDDDDDEEEDYNDEGEEDDDDDDNDDGDDDVNVHGNIGNQPVSIVSAGIHRSSSLRSNERIIIYRCKSCYCDICISSLIISKDFWGNKGEAYFVKDVLNVREDPKEVMKHMRTGQYGVKLIYCVQCDTVIGWKYITSIEPVEKYKVGKYVIEKNLLKTYKVPECVT